MVFIIDEGHEFGIEDFNSYAIAKIEDLKKQGYSYEDILLYDDSIVWFEFIIKFLKRYDDS